MTPIDSSVTIKLINKSDNPLPAYATPHSAGLDLRAYLPSGAVILAPLQRIMIPTGLFMELPEGYEAQVRPRSGLALKSGITVINSPGTIDADYRGEIGILLINLSREPFEIKSGDRIAQMVISPYTRANLIETQSLAETQRGSGGFGHTGRE